MQSSEEMLGKRMKNMFIFLQNNLSCVALSINPVY